MILHISDQVFYRSRSVILVLIMISACTSAQKTKHNVQHLPEIALPQGVNHQIKSEIVGSNALNLAFEVSEFSSHSDIDRILKSIHHQATEFTKKNNLSLNIELYIEQPPLSTDPVAASQEMPHDDGLVGSLTLKKGEHTPTTINIVQPDLIAFSKERFEKKQVSAVGSSVFVGQQDSQSIVISEKNMSPLGAELTGLPKNTCERISVLIQHLLTKNSPVKIIRFSYNPSVIYTANNESTSVINDFMQHIAATRDKLAAMLKHGKVTKKQTQQEISHVKETSCAQALALTSKTGP